MLESSNLRVQFPVAILLYGLLFSGIGGAGNGSFWKVWCLLSLSLAFYHLLFFLVFNIASAFASSWNWLLIPSGLVSYEYLRHLLVRIYDGSGLTFGIVGQFVPLSSVAQFASWGGIWLLSFILAMIGMLCLHLADRRCSTSRRSASCVGLMAIAGVVWINDRSLHNIVLEDEVLVITIPFALHGGNVPLVREWIDEIINSDSVGRPRRPQLVALGAETMIETELVDGQIRFNNPNAAAWKSLSHDARCDAVIGAWVFQENAAGQVNAAIQLRDGEVVGVEPKQHLTPSVESQPLGTQWLIAVGWVPESLVRRVIPYGAAKQTLQSLAEPIDIQMAVCYDLFFGKTYRDRVTSSTSMVTCSLSESFDSTGIFQQLSLCHSSIRAIEVRRSLVRCSYGGITAAFDPWGQEIQPSQSRLGMNLYRVPVYRHPSVYVRSGDWIVWFSLAVTGVWLLKTGRDAWLLGGRGNGD